MYTNAIEPANRVMPSATRFCRLFALVWAYARRSGWVTRWIGTGISTGFLLIRIPAHYRTSLPLRQSLGFHSRLRIGTHSPLVFRLSSTRPESPTFATDRSIGDVTIRNMLTKARGWW